MMRIFQGLKIATEEVAFRVGLLSAAFRAAARAAGVMPPNYVDRGTQQLLAMEYRALAEEGTALPFDEVEFRNHSQNGEDGILWYIFSLVGASNKKTVEICAADGLHCNSANLILNHGWTGLLVDGNGRLVRRGTVFYHHHPDTFIYPPKLVHSWVTAENVNSLLEAYGLSGEVDLLSLDMDGVEYWIWKAIEVISPRVVVAEVQSIWGSEVSVTVPYRPDFRGEFADGYAVYSGASLPAFVKLGREKGYRLVGCQRYGFNAFFLRNDVAPDFFPEVEAASCFSHPFAQWVAAELRPRVANREWIAV